MKIYAKPVPKEPELLRHLKKCGDARGGRVIIGTHSSSIHADECLAIAVIEVALPDYHITVIRSRDPEELARADARVDIGGGTLDHHTTECVERYNNGVLMASCGKVLREVEQDRAMYNQLLWSTFYAVEAADNGQPDTILPPGCPKTKFGFVPSMNPTWEEGGRTDGEMLEVFYKIKDMCKEIYLRARAHAQACIDSQALLPRCPRLQKGQFIELPSGGVPWLSYAYKNPEILGAVYPDMGNKDIQVIRLAKSAPSTKDLRVEFPDDWAGKEDKLLQDVSHVPGALFCHPGKFLMTVRTRHDVEQVCRIISAKYEFEQHPAPSGPVDQTTTDDVRNLGF